MKEKLLIFKEDKLDLKATISVICLCAVICGIVGFIYETFFYKIDLGYFIKRGATYGPWIPIYGEGGILIVLLTYRFKKNPWAIFFLNCLITGTLEYFTGFFLDKWFGLRPWNYDIELWNWGNINGYICARSILFFGISSLILIYFIVPKVIKLAKKYDENKFMVFSVGLAGLFLLDYIVYSIVNYSVLLK